MKNLEYHVLCASDLYSLLSLFLALEKFVMEFLSPRHLSLSGCHPLELSILGDPTDSNSSAGLALRVNWNSQTLHHSKGEIIYFLYIRSL